MIGPIFWEVQSRQEGTPTWYSHDDLRADEQEVMPPFLWLAVKRRIQHLAERKGGFGPLSTPGVPEPPPLMQKVLKTRCEAAAPGDEVDYAGHAFRYVQRGS